MSREAALKLADKFAVMTAGWVFNAVTLEQFYKEAYEAGYAAAHKDIKEEQQRCYVNR